MHSGRRKGGWAFREAVGCLLGVLLLLLPAIHASAQPAAPRPAVSLQGGFGFSGTTYRMAAVERDELETFSFGVQFDVAPRFYEVFAARLEWGLALFGPVCFENDGACEQDAPTLKSIAGALALGIYTPAVWLGPPDASMAIALGLYAGSEWVHAWRGASRCVNCIDESLSLRGGPFLEPTLELSVFRDAGLAAAYRLYGGASDLQGRFTLRFFFR
jgi:hypothetical protein